MWRQRTSLFSHSFKTKQTNIINGVEYLCVNLFPFFFFFFFVIFVALGGSVDETCFASYSECASTLILVKLFRISHILWVHANPLVYRHMRWWFSHVFEPRCKCDTRELKSFVTHMPDSVRVSFYVCADDFFSLAKAFAHEQFSATEFTSAKCVTNMCRHHTVSFVKVINEWQPMRVYAFDFFCVNKLQNH